MTYPFSRVNKQFDDGCGAFVNNIHFGTIADG